MILIQNLPAEFLFANTASATFKAFLYTFINKDLQLGYEEAGIGLMEDHTVDFFFGW